MTSAPSGGKSVPGHAAWGRSHSQFLIPKPRSKTGFVKDTNMEKVAPGVTQGPGLGHEMGPRTNTLGKTKTLVHPSTLHLSVLSLFFRQISSFNSCNNSVSYDYCYPQLIDGETEAQ